VRVAPARTRWCRRRAQRDRDASGTPGQTRMSSVSTLPPAHSATPKSASALTSVCSLCLSPWGPLPGAHAVSANMLPKQFHKSSSRTVRVGASMRTASMRTHCLAHDSTAYHRQMSTRLSRMLAASAVASGSSVECSRRDVASIRRTAAGGAASGRRCAVVDSTQRQHAENPTSNGARGPRLRCALQAATSTRYRIPRSAEMYQFTTDSTVTAIYGIRYRIGQKCLRFTDVAVYLRYGANS
jgi:hypothetical protein